MCEHDMVSTMYYMKQQVCCIVLFVSKRRGGNVHIYVFMCIEYFWMSILETGLSTASK